MIAISRPAGSFPSTGERRRYCTVTLIVVNYGLQWLIG